MISLRSRLALFTSKVNHQEWNVVQLQQGEYSCKILASYGASLISYKHLDYEFVEGYTQAEEIQNQKYRGVILAPFPNRVARAQYTFKNEDYHLAVNREKEGLALHGLLYDQAFGVDLQSEGRVVLSFNYSKKKEGYPFLFSLIVSYELKSDGSLNISTTVENKEDKMPFGLGWHPYFKMNESIDDLTFEFPPSRKIELDRSLIPTGNHLPFNSVPKTLDLSLHQFDDCFELLSEESIGFKLIGRHYILEIKGGSLEEFPFFQIYTPKNRTSIAIEPMTCAPDAFNNQMGLMILNPMEKRTFSYKIKACHRA